MAKKSVRFTALACSPYLAVAALVFLCSVAAADAHPASQPGSPGSIQRNLAADFAAVATGPPATSGEALLQSQTCTQWSVGGTWKLQVTGDGLVIGDPAVKELKGQVRFTQNGTRLEVVINYDGLSGAWGGTGTLVGDKISFPVFEIEDWTGTVKTEWLIQGQVTRKAKPPTPAGSFAWEATPSQPNQVARCITGSPPPVAPSSPLRPECQGLFLSTLLSRGSSDGIRAMESLIDENRRVFTEDSLEQAQKAYDSVALDSRFTGLDEQYRRFVSLLEYMSELRYSDGKPASPGLRLLRPVIYTMLIRSKGTVDYSVAAGRLTMYVLMIDNAKRCE